MLVGRPILIPEKMIDRGLAASYTCFQRADITEYGPNRLSANSWSVHC